MVRDIGKYCLWHSGLALCLWTEEQLKWKLRRIFDSLPWIEIFRLGWLWIRRYRWLTFEPWLLRLIYLGEETKSECSSITSHFALPCLPNDWMDNAGKRHSSSFKLHMKACVPYTGSENSCCCTFVLYIVFSIEFLVWGRWLLPTTPTLTYVKVNLNVKDPAHLHRYFQSFFLIRQLLRLKVGKVILELCIFWIPYSDIMTEGQAYSIW